MAPQKTSMDAIVPAPLISVSRTAAKVPLRKRLLTIQEAAEYLGRTAPALRELQWAGKIPYIQEGRRIHFDLHDLDEWIASHKRQIPGPLE